MKSLLLLLFCAACTLAHTQPQLERELSNSLRLGASDALLLPDGSFLLSAFSSPATFDSTMAILIKLNSELELTWAKRYRVLQRDDFSCLTLLSDGNVPVGGTMRQDFSLQNGASVIKMDTAGQVIWQYLYSGSFNDRTLAMFEQADSSLMVFVRHGVTNQPTKILHLSSNGDLLSSRTYYIGTQGVFADNIVADSLGNYYLSGNFYNGDSGRNELFVCALVGNTLSWYKRYDFGGNLSNSSLVLMPDGQLVAGGFMAESLLPTSVNSWIVSMDGQGIISWANKYQQTEFYQETISNLLPMNDGSLLGFGQAANDTSNEGMVMSIAGNGELNWVRGFYQQMSQSIIDGKVLSDGQLFLRGSFGTSIFLLRTTAEAESYCSDASINLTVSPMAFTESMFVPTLDTPNIDPTILALEVSPAPITERLLCSGTVGISQEVAAPSIRLYPNPSHELLFLDLRQGMTHSPNIRVMNGMGQEVLLPIRQQGSQLQLDVSTLPPGPYWLSFSAEGQPYQQTFLKQ